MNQLRTTNTSLYHKNNFRSSTFDPQIEQTKDWRKLESHQIVANRREMSREQEFINHKKNQYKEELDLIIKLKNRQKEIQTISKKSEIELLNEKVKNALEVQSKFDKTLKEYERTSLETSFVDLRDRRQSLNARDSEMKIREREELGKTQAQMSEEKRKKNIDKVRNMIDNNHTLNEHSQFLQRKKLEEKKQEKLYSESEMQMIEKMLQKNEEFRDAIRNRLNKYQACQRVTQTVVNDYMSKKRMEDNTINKNYQDRLESELLKEKQHLEDIKSRKGDLNQCLLKQIQENAIERETKLFNDIQAEHKQMIEQEDKLDAKARYRKNHLCEMMKETLMTLKRQIENRKSALMEKYNMTKNEIDLNNPKASENDNRYLTEKTLQFVPGYAHQYDKTLMDAYQEKAIDCEKQNIESVLKQCMGSKENDCLKTNMIKIIKKKSAKNSLPQLKNFKNEYEFIRNRGKNGMVNIIL